MNVAGKVAFITGSAGDLGKGFAEALLKEGAKVYLNDINAERGLSTLKTFQEAFGSDNVRFSVLDVTNNDQFEDVFKEAVKEFGHVDIMVNNAGVLNEVNYELAIGVMLTGMIRGTKIAEKHMRKDNGGKGGRVINVSSVVGLDHYFTTPVYCAAKHGIRSYTYAKSQQPGMRKQGLEYAVLLPDLTNAGVSTTPLTEDVIEDPDELLQAIHSAQFIPAQDIVDAFMHLVKLEQMTGALLRPSFDGITFRKMEHVSIGTTFTGDELRTLPSIPKKDKK